MIRILSVLLLLVLAGCGGQPPVYISTPLPQPPHECVSPATREPKLDETRDATDLDAVKDRVALKNAFRRERGLRRSCGTQIKKLLGDK
jgi:hypothetical protein